MNSIQQHCVVGAIVEHRQQMQERDKALVSAAMVAGILVPIVLSIIF